MFNMRGLFLFFKTLRELKMPYPTKLEDLPKRDPNAPVIRRVVCTANLQKNGTILLGARHWDALMHATAAGMTQTWSKEEIQSFIDKEVQGFIDQFGVFMDRAEAWQVALAAGQIRYIESWNYIPSRDRYELYSENLY